MVAMEVEMHIDVYTIIMFHLSTTLFVYQLAIPINRIDNIELRSELKKLRGGYDGALGLGDIIIWPVILTIVYPFYALIRLTLNRCLMPLLKSIFKDRQRLQIYILIFLVWAISIACAILHWIIAYMLIFIPALISFVAVYKKEKVLYES